MPFPHRTNPLSPDFRDLLSALSETDTAGSRDVAALERLRRIRTRDDH
jgi:hypothetical protein